MVGDVLGTERFEGMLGFDWVTYRGDPLPVDADMSIRVVLRAEPRRDCATASTSPRRCRATTRTTSCAAPTASTSTWSAMS